MILQNKILCENCKQELNETDMLFEFGDFNNHELIRTCCYCGHKERK